MTRLATLSSSFALSAASLFLAACGGSGAEPAEPTPPATAAEPPAPAGDHAATGHAEPAADEVRCLGINACKAQAACHMPNGHACAGQNECKGKGWILASATDCAAKGGTVQPE